MTTTRSFVAASVGAAALVLLLAAAASAAGLARDHTDQAELWVRVHPWAEVSIDGGPARVTPWDTPQQLEPGEHEVVLSHPLYGERRVQVTLAAEQSASVRIDLAEPGNDTP